MSYLAKVVTAFPRGMRSTVAALPALGALGATGVFFFWIRAREAGESDRLFARHAESVAASIEARVDTTDDALLALRVLIENSAEVTADEFQHAARSLRLANPDLSAVEWVSCVPGGERAAFEAGLQEDTPGFMIRRMQPGQPGTPAPEAAEYWPVTRVSPVVGNEAALGFDLRTGPTVATLQRARATGALAVSPPLRLVQDPADQLSVIFILPAFHRHTNAFLGWVQGLARIQKLFATPAAAADRLGLALRCDDLAPSAAATRKIFGTPSLAAVSGTAAWSQDMDAGGRRWRISAWPVPGALPPSQTPWLVLALGAAASALLALYLRTLLRRARTVERMVEQRTAELASTNRALAGEIDQRLQVEVALRAARDRFEGLVNSVQGIVWEYDLARQRPRFVSRQAEALLGYPSARWTDDTDFWRQLVHPDDRARFFAALERRAPAEHHFVETCRMRAEDGRLVWMQGFFRVLHGGDGRPVALLGLSLDVTALRLAEEVLARDALILASVRDAIVVADPGRRITFWNAGAEALFGWSAADMLGRRLPERIALQRGPELSALIAEVAGGRDWRGEWEIARRDGSSLWVDLSLRRFADAQGQPAGIIAVAFDITARRRQQEEQLAFERRLQETQKLESLGVLAGGIAHDFNNLLTGILGNASLLRIDLPPQDPRHEELAAIEAAGRRAADLCQQMLAYSGRARFVLKSLDLSALVEDTTRLIQASVAKSAQLEFQLARDLPPVHADATQLRQIVMNLVITASDALEGRPGRIAVATTRFSADRAWLDATMFGRDLTAGDYALLEVRDTGCGMVRETLARIFEPFFTTKFTGRGLGLAAVLGIVRSHRGTLQVDSEPGRGTAFRVYLPTTAAAAPPPAEAPAAGRSLRGTGRVLVIDDEALVRDTAGHVLAAGGYEVECAADGAAGVAAFARQPQAFAAVLIDYAMPHLNGAETFAELRRLNAHTPAILMSGYSSHEAFASFGASGLAAFLQKPFLADELLAAVRDAIQRGAARPP